jgi:hypothetical protein
VGQVVGDGDEAAVARERDVAGVDARPRLGHHDQIVEVVLGDPAVARAEIDEAPVGGELGPAVQREAALEAMQRLEAVAVEDGDVVIAALDDDEEVQGVGGENRLVRERHRLGIDHPRGGDRGLIPIRDIRKRGVDQLHEDRDLGLRQAVAIGRHLGRGPALGDDPMRLGLPEPAEVLRQ